MREGQPSVKGFCDLGFKAGKLLGHSSTRRRRQVPSSKGHLATSQRNLLLTSTLTNPVTVILIIFMTYCVSFYMTNLRVYTQMKSQKTKK